MGKGRNLRQDEIAVITAMTQAGRPTTEIHDVTGLNLRTIQHWAKKFRDSNGNVELQRKSTGRPTLISATTIRWLKREIDRDPFITARTIKGEEPRITWSCQLRYNKTKT